MHLGIFFFFPKLLTSQYLLKTVFFFPKVLFLTLIKKKKTNYSGRKKENTACVFVVILKTKLISCTDHASKLGQRVCLHLITINFFEHKCALLFTESTSYSLFNLITTVTFFKE